MTPQELKNSIFQLAIQGKLVEQRAEEGTAAELLEKILATKNTKGGATSPLPALGNLAQRRRGAEKGGSPIPDDEKPFDIPDSWVWVRLGDVASIERGSGIKRSETSSSGFPCVRYGEIYTTYGYSFTSTKSFVTETVASSCHKANHGDVLCTLTGEWKEEIAKATAYLGKAPIAVGGDLAKISSYAFDSVLLVYFFFAPFMIQQKAAKANGTMIVHIGKEAVSNLLIPLPPLAEQKRIVAKIEELLPLIDRYEKAWSKLEDFNKRFPVDMRKSLLQMAIQGKLVDQRPEEGTGAELLEKILAAKGAKSTKGGATSTLPALGNLAQRRRGAEKGGSPIPDDEKPFNIPESWEWVRLGEIALKVTDGTHKTPRYTERGIRFLSAKDICGERLSFDKCRFISEEEHHELFSRCNPEKGDLLVSKSGSIGSVALVEVDFEFSLFESLGLIKYDQTRVSPQYLQRAVQVACLCLNPERVRGVAVKHLPIADIKALPIPLPPFAEQKRIVAKLEEILPLCERLK